MVAPHRFMCYDGRMQTDTIQAYQVEVGDLIRLGGDTVFEVVDFDDYEGIELTLKNDDGEKETFAFRAFEDIELVVSLDDPDDQLLDLSL